MREPLLAISSARQLVLDAVRPLDHEQVAVTGALDRVLAEDVVAANDVPPFDNSAMDGFAVRVGGAGRRLQVIGESRAGVPATGAVGPQQAVRISTGAVLPAGAEAVVPVEDAEPQGEEVVLAIEAQPGLNVRRAGDDLHAGQPILPRGQRLGPAELGVCVAAGRGELTCARRPRVTVLCTGDELREPGAPLRPGEIHNSNAVTLAGLARRSGAEVDSGQRIGDRPEATREVLGAALTRCDVLVVSGGVSVGPHDHVKPALRDLGVREVFWRVALRPGRPTWFGVRDGQLVFGLPGNPVSAMVTFLLFVAPALAALQGAEPAARRRYATLAQAIARNPGRDEAVRVRLEENEDGLRAEPTGPQGSHQLTSMLGADALLIVTAGDGEVAAGTRAIVDLV